MATISLSIARVLLSLIDLENNFLSITTPLNDGLAFKEASLTSPALSPKIALEAFLQELGQIHL